MDIQKVLKYLDDNSLSCISFERDYYELPSVLYNGHLKSKRSQRT